MSYGKIFGSCLVVAMLSGGHWAYAYQWGELELRPWASVQEEYDSNITYAHTGVQSDFITAPRIGAEAIYTGRNQNADVNLSLEEQLFSKYSQYDNLSEYLTSTYNNDFSYYDHMKLSDNFEHAEDPVNFAEQFGRTNGRYQYYENGFDSEWTHDFTDQFSLTYKFLNNYYDPLMEGLSSSVQYKPGIEAMYDLNSILKLLSYADYTYRDFSQFGSMNKESIGMGIRNYWTPQLYLEGRAGEDIIQPIVGNDTLRGHYEVSLNDQRDQRTLYTLSFSKQYQDTPYSEFLFNCWQVMLEVKQDVTARLSLYASAFTGGGVYVGEGEKEQLSGVGAGVIFHVTKNVDFRAEYRFSDNESNTPTDAYLKHTALLELTFKF